MKDAKILLELLTESIPPGPNQHHCITLADDGSAQVTLMLGHVYLPITLEPGDFEVPVSELADRIMLVESSSSPPVP